MPAADSREQQRLSIALARKLVRLASRHPDILNELRSSARFAKTEMQHAPIDLQASGGEGPESISEVLSRRRKAWTVAEIAELLSLSERTLYDQIKSGSLKANRIATILRLCPKAVFDWYSERVTNPK